MPEHGVRAGGSRRKKKGSRRRSAGVLSPELSHALDDSLHGPLDTLALLADADADAQCDWPQAEHWRESEVERPRGGIAIPRSSRRAHNQGERLHNQGAHSLSASDGDTSDGWNSASGSFEKSSGSSRRGGCQHIVKPVVGIAST